jgi:hypothetical protein
MSLNSIPGAPYPGGGGMHRTQFEKNKKQKQNS